MAVVRFQNFNVFLKFENMAVERFQNIAVVRF